MTAEKPIIGITMGDPDKRHTAVIEDIIEYLLNCFVVEFVFFIEWRN